MLKTIAFQGKEGAYSDLACRAAFPKLKTVPCASFAEVFEAVHKGKADLAMIPIDNSIAGRVADIHYLLPKYDLYFVGEHFLPVRHCLLGVEGAKLSDVRKVYSHVHALPQCRKLIRKMGWEPVVFGDTAGAAQKVANMNDKTCAAIASALAAEIYGLKVLQEDIADEQNNITRFLALSRKPVRPRFVKDQTYVTSFIFSVRNIPAALYKALGGFATNNINMLKIESYMTGGKFYSTLFYCEVEGHGDDPRLKRAVEELRFFAEGIRLLGTYPASPGR
jgi:prephenate dehydratase